MAAFTHNKASEQVAQALVEFALHGAFPEEAVSSAKIGPTELPPAIDALAAARSKLQVRPSLDNTFCHHILTYV